MYKVILLGDTDYEQSHVVTQITKVLKPTSDSVKPIRTKRPWRNPVIPSTGDTISEEGRSDPHLRRGAGSFLCIKDRYEGRFRL